MDLAVEYYKEAAELYGVVQFHKTDHNKLSLKVADLYSQMFGEL